MVTNQLPLDKQRSPACRGKSWILLGALFFSACSPQQLFFYPNRNLYADPDRMEIPAHVVQFASLNGRQLYGLFIPTAQTPKGTVVHFHGNFGNVSNHFPLALFLTHHGYDVLAFDYEGYGASQGQPTAARLVQDGRAAVRWAQAHRRGGPASGVAVFGQSLGGAVAIVVAAQEPEVKAAVIEAAFSGYRAMAGAAARRHVLTLPFYVPVPFLPRKADPIRYVGRISPRPVFFIHGDRDTIVPVEMSRRLFAAAREPKALWIVPGAGHLECRRIAGPAYDEKIVRFLDKALRPKQPSRF